MPARCLATTVWAAGASIFFASTAAALDCAPREQWYTGSLLSIGGPMGKGQTLVNPYYTGAQPITHFDAWGQGHSAPSTAPRTIGNYNSLAYGLTEELTLATGPAFSYLFDSAHTSRDLQGDDLPLAFKYRFIDAQPKNCVPAIAAIIGVTAPIGRFSHLQSSEQGVGAGVWSLRFGFTSDISFRLADDLPLRMRVWGLGVQPFSSVGLKGVSAYGTSSDFFGRAYPHMSGSFGASWELGLTREWVLSFDVMESMTASGSVRGWEFSSGPTFSRLSTSSTFTVAPAIEYNWSANFGIIVGASVDIAGHNATGAVTPQMAINLVF